MQRVSIFHVFQHRHGSLKLHCGLSYTNGRQLPCNALPDPLGATEGSVSPGTCGQLEPGLERTTLHAIQGKEFSRGKVFHRTVLLPFPAFKKRVVAQATVSGCRFVELWPAALHQRLRRLHPAVLLLVTGLHQDNPDSVELLDESQGFLELRLALGYLQRAVQQLHRVLPLDVPLSRAQGLVRIK